MGEKGLKTKAMICDKAYILFAAKGFKEVTMTDICNQTGLSRGGLYRHYGSTAEIFRDILSKEYPFDDWIAKGVSAKNLLTQTLQLIEDEINQKELSLSLAIYEFANQGNEDFFCEIHKKAQNRWRKFLEYGMEQGEFRQVNIDQVVQLILLYYQGLRMWSRVLPLPKESAKHYSDVIYEILLGGNHD